MITVHSAALRTSLGCEDRTTRDASFPPKAGKPGQGRVNIHGGSKYTDNQSGQA